MEYSLVTYGFNKDREGIEKLGSVSPVIRLIYLYSILHSLLVTIGNFTNSYQSKLFERELVAHFLLDNSSKGFDAEHWWEIYLVAYLTRSVI